MSGRDAAGGGLITWADLFAAKKWPFRNLPDLPVSTGHIQRKMVRIDLWQIAFSGWTGVSF
jgi:hypothetical protein